MDEIFELSKKLEEIIKKTKEEVIKEEYSKLNPEKVVEDEKGKYVICEHELVEMEGYNIDISPNVIIIKSKEGKDIFTISYTRGFQDKPRIDLLNIETDDIVQFFKFLVPEKSENGILNIIIRSTNDYWVNYEGTNAYEYWIMNYNLAGKDRTDIRFCFNELLDNIENGIKSEYFVKYIENKEMDVSTFEYIIENIDQYESFFSREHEFFGDIFSRMFGFDQENSNHDRNLWEHTKSAVENIPQAVESIEGITQREITLLKVAAILHDIGKAEPGVKQPKPKTGPNGKIEYGYNGHAKKSAELAVSILDKLGYSDDEKRIILKLVELHDAFIGLDFKSEPSKKEKKLSLDEKDLKAHRLFNNKALKDLSLHELKLITIISEADIGAQDPKKAEEKLDKLNIVRELISDREEEEIKAEEILATEAANAVAKRLEKTEEQFERTPDNFQVKM